MPELSRFYGIVIAMFVERGGQHHLPHFHAFYQDYAASFSIETLELLEKEGPMHKLYRVTEFRIAGPYTLWVRFDDGSAQVIDFEPVLSGYYYGPLRDLKLFNQVKIDPNIHTLVWPNGADFDPETLRNWPQYRQAWIDAAQEVEATKG